MPHPRGLGRFSSRFTWGRAGDAKSNDATRPSRSPVLAAVNRGSRWRRSAYAPLGRMELVDGEVGQQALKLAAVL
jgi:hypothetical protein